MKSTKFPVAAVIAFQLVCVSLSTAGTINLNDVYNGGNPFMGTDVMFTNVVETNGSAGSPAINYYQTPSVVGNSLIVNPVNFRAEVNPGPGVSLVDSQLEMVIMSLPGRTVDQIKVTELGDFLVAGLAANAATVTAELNYFFEVLAGPTPGVSGSGTATFSRTASPNASGVWDLSAMIDLAAVAPGATKVRFEFDNRLFALAAANGAAFIAKKQIPGIIITIPEPASMGIVAMGLGLALGARLRKPRRRST